MTNDSDDFSYGEAFSRAVTAMEKISDRTHSNTLEAINEITKNKGKIFPPFRWKSKAVKNVECIVRDANFELKKAYEGSGMLTPTLRYGGIYAVGNKTVGGIIEIVFSRANDEPPLYFEPLVSLSFNPNIPDAFLTATFKDNGKPEEPSFNVLFKRKFKIDDESPTLAQRQKFIRRAATTYWVDIKSPESRFYFQPRKEDDEKQYFSQMSVGDLPSKDAFVKMLMQSKPNVNALFNADILIQPCEGMVSPVDATISYNMNARRKSSHYWGKLPIDAVQMGACVTNFASVKGLRHNLR